MNIKCFRTYVFFALAALLLPSWASAGVYTDRDGATHTWSIDDSHALIWEGEPYIPFAVAFEPRYLSSGKTDENWAADEEDVAAFAVSGVTDVVLKTGKGLTSVPPEDFQRVIDLLEEYEIRYGLELYDPPYAPLSGYIINPVENRIDEIFSSGDLRHPVPESKTVLYALCDARTAELRDLGREIVVNGEVTVKVALQTSGPHVLLLYPEKTISPDEISLFDVWSDYERHRDRLILYMAKIKFGKGLRFFADPFSDKIGLLGESENMIPTSTAYRFEYATWLSRRYNSPRDLNIAWGILKHDIASFEEAARLVPLWQKGRGVPAVYDGSTAKTHAVDASTSMLWRDFTEFRGESVRNYMDSAADAIKRVSADVPVIYTANALQPIFQASGQVGFDGLAAAAAGTGEDLFKRAGRAYSLVENSERKLWLAARLIPEGTAYQKKEDLFAAINASRALGAKAFIVSDTSRTAIEGANLLAWLGEYASFSSHDKHFASHKPQAVYYPHSVEHTAIRKFANGVWWLPALIPGNTLYLGANLAGYTVVDPALTKPDVQLWSLQGTQDVQLVAHNDVTVVSLWGEETIIRPDKKKRVSLAIGEEPITIKGMALADFLPVEVVEEAIVELEKAIAEAERKKFDASDYKDKVKSAKDMLDRNQLSLCLNLVQETIRELNHRVRGLNVMPGVTVKEG